MAKCRSCDAVIEWVETTNGKNHPVDPGYIEFDDAEPGDKLVTDGGNVVVKREGERRPSIKGRMSHFSTCPDAKDWRRKP